MEYIVEAMVPTAAPEAILEGLFEELDLTGGAAEVLYGEANKDASTVHVAFQIEAPNERRAKFEVMQVMSPVLHSLDYESAAAAEYIAREVGEYEKKYRWSVPSPRAFMVGIIAASAAAGLVIASGIHGVEGARVSGAFYLVAQAFGLL